MKPTSHFYLQLATLLNAGVSISAALQSLADSSPSRNQRQWLGNLALATSRGSSISVALSGSSKSYPAMHNALIEAGEKTGALVTMLRQLSTILEEQRELKRQLIMQMFYPKLIMVIALLFWPIVLERFSDNPILQVCLGVLPLVSFGLLLITEFLVARVYGAAYPQVEFFIAKVPVLSKAAKNFSEALFLKNFVLLYDAGVELPICIRTAGAACGNASLALRVQRYLAEANFHGGVTVTLAKSGIFSPFTIALMQTGEVTGNFKTPLSTGADYYDSILRMSLHEITVFLGVLATLNVGLCVGLICYSVYV